ncbi:MAG: hypothetical protein WBC51_13965, partial [Vicinamibacterales bacterium]
EALLEALYSDVTVSHYFRPQTTQVPVELHGILASYVESWRNSGVDVEHYSAQTADELLLELRRTERSCTAFRIAYGVEVGPDSPGFQLSFGLQILSATRANLEQLFLSAGASADEAIRVPRGPAALLVVKQRVSRDEMTDIAATTAAGFSLARTMQLRIATWLASGIPVTLGDSFVFEDSLYPAVPFNRIPAEPTSAQRDGDRGLLDAEVAARVEEVLRQLAPFWAWLESSPPDADRDHLMYTTLAYLEAAINSIDWAFVLFLTYAVMDGMILRRDDHDSNLMPRIAWLIGSSDAERKAIRKLLNELYQARSKVAHGERPTYEEIARLLDRSLDEGREAQDGNPVLRFRLERDLRMLCIDLVRKTFLAFLWHLVQVDGRGIVSFPRTREQIISLTESAHLNDPEAKDHLGQNPVVQWWKESPIG